MTLGSGSLISLIMSILNYDPMYVLLGLGLILLLLGPIPVICVMMASLSSLTLGDALTACLLIAAIVTLCLMYRTEKARFFKDLYLEMFKAPDIRKAYYQIEYGQFVYDEDFRGSEQEKMTDRLLAFANLVCDFYNRKVIDSKDMTFFDFEFKRVYQDSDVQAYLGFLDEVYRRSLTETPPFLSFRNYCKARNWDRKVELAAKWESDSFHKNLARMLPLVSRHAGLDFREKVENEVIRGVRGPLYERLGRLETVGNAYPGAKFYGKLIGKVGAVFGGLNAKGVITRLSPFFTWDYGIYALKRGLENLGWENAGELLKVEHIRGPELVEAIWSIGLLDILGLGDECVSAADDLRTAPKNSASVASECEAVIADAGQQIATFAQDKLRVPGPQYDREDDEPKLWQNAVAIAKHHYQGKNPDDFRVFKDLLRHVAEGKMWPLDCSCNKEFEKRHKEVSEFRKDFRLEPLDESLGWKVEFLADPLEILNIGNIFSSCLRLGDDSAHELLGWATNVNVRVIVVRDGKGKILARRTIGLSVEDSACVLQCPTYPPGNRHFKRAIDEFVKRFLDDTNLKAAYKRNVKVEGICADSYNKDWLEKPPEDELYDP